MTSADLEEAEPRRNVGLLVFGSAISLLGDGMLTIALAFAVFELGGGPLELGVIVMGGLLATFVTILPAGAFADRTSRKRIAVGSDVLRALTQWTSAALVIADVASPWLLLPTTVVFGIGTALHQPATVGFIAEVVPGDRLLSVNGMIQGARGVTMVLGAALGGWLVEAFNAGVVLVVDGASFLACAIAFACIRVRLDAPRNDVAVHLRDVIASAKAQPWLMPGILIITAFLFATIGPLQIVGPTIAERAGTGASLWSIISTALATGIVIGGASAALGRVKAPLRAARVLLVIGATGHLALALDAPVVLMFPGYMAFGGAMGVYLSSWETTKQRHVPRETLSRIGALDWFLNLIGGMSGVTLGTIVVNAYGPTTMLYVMVATTLMVVVATLLSRPLREIMVTKPTTSA